MMLRCYTGTGFLAAALLRLLGWSTSLNGKDLHITTHLHTRKTFPFVSRASVTFGRVEESQRTPFQLFQASRR